MRTLFLLLIPAALFAQGDGGLQQGRALFRSNCAFCHGMTAKGGRGPNLVSAPLNHGDTDASIKQVIRIGVPGTTMPAFSEFTDEEVAQVIGYLHSLSGGEKRRLDVPGNPRHGEQLYAGNGCAGCHRIGTDGSVFGPELTRVGAARSLEYLRESIVNPSADVPEEWQGVTVTLQNGTKVRGIRINEDTFTLQLRDPSQKYRMFSKSETKAIAYDSKSMMPAYSKLSPADLDDLVAYLASLRGAVDAGAAVKKAGGIK